MVSRSRNPDYEQVCGYVPAELATEFRVACTRRKVNQSEALEDALHTWVYGGKDKLIELLQGLKDGTLTEGKISELCESLDVQEHQALVESLREQCRREKANGKSHR